MRSTSSPTSTRRTSRSSQSLAKPPGGVDLVCVAAGHLQACIDPNIEVDKKGKVKDGSWNVAFMHRTGGFKVDGFE